MLFGIIGTLSSFFCFLQIAQIVFGSQLNFVSAVILAATLCSSDTVAPLSFIDPKIYGETLFSVVFGEGVMNDVISILLISAVGSMPADGLNYSSLMANVVYLLITSSLCGICFGVLISYMSMRFRKERELKLGKLKKEREPEIVILVFFSNFLCYLTAEVMELSSVFAIFISGMICGKYVKYNMSKKARFYCEHVFKVLSHTCEAAMFGYGGLTSFGYLSYASAHYYDVVPMVFGFGISLVLVRLTVVFSLFNSSLYIVDKSKKHLGWIYDKYVKKVKNECDEVLGGEDIDLKKEDDQATKNQEGIENALLDPMNQSKTHLQKKYSKRFKGRWHADINHWNPNYVIAEAEKNALTFKNNPELPEGSKLIKSNTANRINTQFFGENPEITARMSKSLSKKNSQNPLSRKNTRNLDKQKTFSRAPSTVNLIGNTTSAMPINPNNLQFVPSAVGNVGGFSQQQNVQAGVFTDNNLTEPLLRRDHKSLYKQFSNLPQAQASSNMNSPSGSPKNLPKNGNLNTASSVSHRTNTTVVSSNMANTTSQSIHSPIYTPPKRVSTHGPENEQLQTNSPLKKAASNMSIAVVDGDTNQQLGVALKPNGNMDNHNVGSNLNASGLKKQKSANEVRQYGRDGNKFSSVIRHIDASPASSLAEDDFLLQSMDFDRMGRGASRHDNLSNVHTPTRQHGSGNILNFKQNMHIRQSSDTGLMTPPLLGESPLNTKSANITHNVPHQNARILSGNSKSSTAPIEPENYRVATSKDQSLASSLHSVTTNQSDKSVVPVQRSSTSESSKKDEDIASKRKADTRVLEEKPKAVPNMKNSKSSEVAHINFNTSNTSISSNPNNSNLVPAPQIIVPPNRASKSGRKGAAVREELERRLQQMRVSEVDESRIEEEEAMSQKLEQQLKKLESKNSSDKISNFVSSRATSGLPEDAKDEDVTPLPQSMSLPVRGEVENNISSEDQFDNVAKNSLGFHRALTLPLMNTGATFESRTNINESALHGQKAEVQKSNTSGIQRSYTESALETKHEADTNNNQAVLVHQLHYSSQLNPFGNHIDPENMPMNSEKAEDENNYDEDEYDADEHLGLFVTEDNHALNDATEKIPPSIWQATHTVLKGQKTTFDRDGSVLKANRKLNKLIVKEAKKGPLSRQNSVRIMASVDMQNDKLPKTTKNYREVFPLQQFNRSNSVSYGVFYRTPDRLEVLDSPMEQKMLQKSATAQAGAFNRLSVGSNAVELQDNRDNSNVNSLAKAGSGALLAAAAGNLARKDRLSNRRASVKSHTGNMTAEFATNGQDGNTIQNNNNTARRVSFELSPNTEKNKTMLKSLIAASSNQSLNTSSDQFNENRLTDSEEDLSDGHAPELAHLRPMLTHVTENEDEDEDEEESGEFEKDSENDSDEEDEDEDEEEDSFEDSASPSGDLLEAEIRASKKLKKEEEDILDMNSDLEDEASDMTYDSDCSRHSIESVTEELKVKKAERQASKDLEAAVAEMEEEEEEDDEEEEDEDTIFV